MDDGTMASTDEAMALIRAADADPRGTVLMLLRVLGSGLATATRERDEARAGFRALAEERDLLRAEVERLREQARVWRTLAHDGSIASRDLGVIGATESALALAACARRAGQHAAQGAEAERETCAMIATPYAARWPCAGDIVAKIRARGAGGGA